MQVTFVCLANISRSPMAEYIFNFLAKRAGAQDRFKAISRGTSLENEGHGIHPRAQSALFSHSVPYFFHTSTMFTPEDYRRSALVIGMDRHNVKDIRRISGGDPKRKVCRLLDFTARPGDIEDPFHTDEFDIAYDQIFIGCQALLARLTKEATCSR